MSLEGGELYRTYLTLSGDGIARFEIHEPFRVDAPEDEQVDRLVKDGHIAECNEVFARLYERSVAEMQGLRVADLAPADDPARLVGIRAFVRSGFRLDQAEEAHTKDDGSVRWVSGSALGVIEDGRLHRYWLTLRDITGPKQAEADRERRGRILEAVAFSSVRLLLPGTWRARSWRFPAA